MRKLRNWHPATEEDKLKPVMYSRNGYTKTVSKVVWNKEWNCWGLVNSPHILIAVYEVADVN